MRLSSLPIALATGFTVLACGVGSAVADCREDHAAADQNVRRTRVAIEKVMNDTEAAKCSAYRRHIAALTEQRGVIARCDTGPNRTQNVSAIDGQITDFSRRAEASCKR
jgi:predicted phage gp36 major capsid-like protein